MLGSTRLDETETSVFTEPSRINSTFGGNLIDMARCSAILKVIEQEHLIDNARRRGEQLQKGLQDLVGNNPQTVFNPRGKGLMCAFDLQSSEARDSFLRELLHEKLLLVGCGSQSIRFRPHLNITEEDVDIILSTLNKVTARQ